MIDYSHLFKERDVRQIQSTIKQMDTESLLRLQDQAEINLNEHSWFTRWPVAAHTVATAAVGAALVALSQPIAKWRGWTNKSLGQYMKHPLAIGAIALETITSVFTHFAELKDTNSVAIARIAEHEMAQRQIDRPVLDRLRGYSLNAQQPANEQSPAAQALTNMAGHSLTMVPVSETGAASPAVTVNPTAEPTAVTAPTEMVAAMTPSAKVTEITEHTPAAAVQADQKAAGLSA